MRRLWRWVLLFRQRNDFDSELAQELEFHLSMKQNENEEAGMDPKHARETAHRQMGNLTLAKEASRELWSFQRIESVCQDLRYAFRNLRNNPAFSIVAVLTLGLGIGANTAIFSVVNAILLQTLPVDHPENLVLLGAGRQSGISDGFPDGPPDLFSQPFFNVLRAKAGALSGIAAMESMRADVHARFDGPSAGMEPLTIRLVSDNYFTIFGVGPAMGRVPDQKDDRPDGSPVAVLSYAFWERRFALERDVIGRTLEFNGTLFTIIGVAAREFSGAVIDESPDLWIPLSMQARVQPWIKDVRSELTQSLWLIGRLRPGETIAGAQAQTNVIYQQWLRTVAGTPPSPDRLADMRKARITLTKAASGISDLRAQFSRPLEILMAIVGLVLLIACGNIANLLLARAAGRQREMSVRLALGVCRQRLIRQLVSESLLMALLGGTLGVLFAWWGSRLLLGMVLTEPGPAALNVGTNVRILLFTFGLALLTGLVFGIAPALRMTNVDLAISLKERKGTANSYSRSRLGQILVGAQVGLALFLMIGAGLFARSLGKLNETDTGFDKDRVLLLRLDASSTGLKTLGLMNVFGRLEERIRRLPGVQTASFAMLGFNEGRWVTPLWPEASEHTEANGKAFDGNRVGAEYFRVLGMPIVMGRSFGPEDTRRSQRVAVVNETLARKLYPGISPLNHRFALSGRDQQAFEIVGVVKDAKYVSLREKPRAMWFLYTEQEQVPDGFNDLLVRLQGDAGTAIRQIREVVRSEEPNLAISQVTTLGETVASSLNKERLLANLAGFFGALALLLASIGLYGVIAYSVSRRTSEIGIRMALGAEPGKVLGMVLRESFLLVALGVAVGIPAALACGRFVASQLYGLQANDPMTIAGSAAAMVTVALIATYLPARRAALLDPLTALREE